MQFDLETLNEKMVSQLQSGDAIGAIDTGESLVSTAETLFGENLIDEYEAAQILSLSVTTLRNYRHLRKGPNYHKLGSSVRYKLSDIMEYIENCKVYPNLKRKLEEETG